MGILDKKEPRIYVFAFLKKIDEILITRRKMETQKTVKKEEKKRLKEIKVVKKIKKI